MQNKNNWVDVSEVSSFITGWHSSQWCPLYSIGSSRLVPMSTVLDAISVVERLINQESASEYEDAEERYFELIEIKDDLLRCKLRHMSEHKLTEDDILEDI
jgi:hypothetical protein